MNPQSTPQPPQPGFTRTSSSSRTSSFRDGFSRYRWVIYCLAGVVILVMALCLLFVAHQYYREFGGQGWLKVRDESQEQDEFYADTLFLPLRKQEVWKVDSQRRSPQHNVPFYVCGDQQSSCETYEQPVSECTWDTLIVGTLTGEPEHMLPTLGNVLRGIVYSVGNFLLQCVQVTIRVSSLRVPPTEMPSISCSMFCRNWWWMLSKERPVFAERMHTYFNRLHHWDLAQFNNYGCWKRNIRSSFYLSFFF